MAVDNKFGVIDIPGIGDDEPVFIIRAKDAISAQAVAAYKRTRLDSLGEPPTDEWIDDIDDVVDRFVLWQADNRELVKLPD